MTLPPSQSDLSTALALDRVGEKLLAASEKAAIPAFARVKFPEQLDASRPVMPVHMLSLHAHPAWAGLSAETQWRAGLLETVNFFSLNIHGEQALVAELVERLYRNRSSGESDGLSRYLQHFIQEENSHTYMLAEFCTRYYGRVMPEIVYRFENPALSRPGRDLLFYSRVYVLETLLDSVNRAAMEDDGMEPTARAVHRSHHLDEVRHLAFDRSIIRALTARMKDQDLGGELRTVELLLKSYADYAFSRLVNPRVYRELGIEDPLKVAREIQQSQWWSARKMRWLEDQQRLFVKTGLYSS